MARLLVCRWQEVRAPPPWAPPPPGGRLGALAARRWEPTPERLQSEEAALEGRVADWVAPEFRLRWLVTTAVASVAEPLRGGGGCCNAPPPPHRHHRPRDLRAWTRSCTRMHMRMRATHTT